VVDTIVLEFSIIVSIDSGKIMKVVDCLKKCNFSYIFGPPAARGHWAAVENFLRQWFK